MRASPVTLIALAALSFVPLAALAGPPAIAPSSGVAVITAGQLHDFDTVWAISDLHGRLDRLSALLEAAHLSRTGGGKGLHWDPGARRQLLVFVGDYIDGGPDSAGVLLAVRDLQREAAGAGSRVLALLGNHEVELLDNPDKAASKELLKSADAHAAALGLHGKASGHDVVNSPIGALLKAMPVCAIVGTWLFAHAGYIDAKDDAGKLQAFFADLGHKRTKDLLSSHSILEDHNWWADKSNVKEMRKRLDLLGLSGLVFGHDPDALGAGGDIAAKDGWLIKLDTGLKDDVSKGEMLQCPAASLAAPGPTRCKRMLHAGAVKDLPSK